jgi:hypothetical protein
VLLPSAPGDLAEHSLSLLFSEFISEMHLVNSLLLSFMVRSEVLSFEKLLKLQKDVSSLGCSPRYPTLDEGRGRFDWY